MNAEPQHVIFGTGAIGLATLDALRRRGETARLVNRSGTAPVPAGIEVLGGHASDPAFTTAAAHGAQVASVLRTIAAILKSCPGLGRRCRC